MENLLNIAPLPISLGTVLFVTLALQKHERNCPSVQTLNKKLDEIHEDVREIRHNQFGILNK